MSVLLIMSFGERPDRATGLRPGSAERITLLSPCAGYRSAVIYTFFFPATLDPRPDPNGTPFRDIVTHALHGWTEERGGCIATSSLA
jgi:hypothetical protein